MKSHPYTHTWDEDGIQRQAQIHLASSGHEVVYDAQYPGDETPWQSLQREGVRYSDDDITSLNR